MKEEREILELRRRTEIHEIEERKNGQIHALMKNHEKSFSNIKNYYNDITLNNLALINSLKEQLNLTIYYVIYPNLYSTRHKGANWRNEEKRRTSRKRNRRSNGDYFFIFRIFTFNLEPKPETKGATAEGARNKWWTETTTGKLWKG